MIVRFRMKDGSVVVKDDVLPVVLDHWRGVLAHSYARLLELKDALDSGRRLPEIWIACDEISKVEVET